MAKKLEIIMSKVIEGYPKVYVSSKIDYDTFLLTSKEVRDLLFRNLLVDMEIKLDAVQVDPTTQQYINLNIELPDDTTEKTSNIL